MKCRKELSDIGDVEVAALLEQKAVRVVSDGSQGFVSSVFFIPKKSGGFRPIINLKPLNRFVCLFNHFKRQNMEVARQMLRKGDWMAKLDLETLI